MGSNFFINHSLGITNNCYRVLGIPVTNVAINSSVGSLFTSGETLSTLMQDVAHQETKNIGSLAGCAVEGLAEMNEEKINGFYHLMLDTIGQLTKGKDEAHFAIKFTGLLSIGVMTLLSTIQYIYLYDILALDKPGYEQLSME